MKLHLAFFAALAEANVPTKNPEADGPKEGVDSQEQPKTTGAPMVHCSQQVGKDDTYTNYASTHVLSVSEDYPEAGFVSFSNYVNGLYCYIDFANACDGQGVDIELKQMAVEPSQWSWNGSSWINQKGCNYDAVKFMYTDANGDTQFTQTDCGIHNGGSWMPYSTYYTGLVPAMTKFSIVGTDLKLVLKTDFSVSGGFAQYNWQCRSYGNDICPSKYDGSADSGCYVQSEPWQPGKNVSCSMENAACMTTTCEADGISAFFSENLFHVNSKHSGSFMEQLQAGHRVLRRADTGAILQDVMDINNTGDLCGYQVVDGGIQLNWNYWMCGVAPTMKNGKITYGITLQALGNDADSDPMIEFYVDFDATAECQYDPEIDLEASFFVNQEDVNAEVSQDGSLEENFDCLFYEDSKRKNQIMDHNIVNMGERIYGRVESKSNAGYGLIYKLQRVTFTDASGKTNPQASFKVVGGGKGSKIVQAKVQKSKYIQNQKYWRPLGENMKFSFLSFGFEDLDEQNAVDIKCHIKIDIDPNVNQGISRSRAVPMADYDDEYNSADWGTYDYYDDEQ